MTKRLSDPTFRYVSASDSAKPGYLHKKWQRMYPNCFRPEKPKPDEQATVTTLRTAKALGSK